MLSWEVARRFYLPLRAKRRLWRLHSHSWLHRCKQLRPLGRLRWAEVCTLAHREEICTWSQWKAVALPCTRQFWAAVCRLSRRRSGQACQTAQWWAGAPAESGAAPELGVNENQRLWGSAKTRRTCESLRSFVARGEAARNQTLELWWLYLPQNMRTFFMLTRKKTFGILSSNRINLERYFWYLRLGQGALLRVLSLST